MLVRDGAPLDKATVAAVLLHGRGQSAAYMQAHLVAPLRRPRVAYLLPQAPGGSWYPGRFAVPLEQLEPELSAALAAVAEAVRTARAGPAAVVLAGFSQGACLVAELLAREGDLGLVGAAVLTGALIGPRGSPGEVRRLEVSLGGLSVEMVSSEHDEWVGPEYVRATARSLADAGADVHLHMTTEPEHRIDEVALAAVAGLLDAATRR